MAEKKLSKDDLIKAIGEMSVLELSEVTKALEEKFGVHTYTAATVYAGLRVAARFAKILGKDRSVHSFDAIADEPFAQFVLARIIEPTSKADSVRVLNEIGVASASLRTMFRALQRAQEHDYRAQIATALFSHAMTHGG